MQSDIEQIKQAADGLWFISESDYPLTLVTLSADAALPADLVSLTGKTGDPLVETQTLEYFFRNMVRTEPGANNETAQRFIALQNLLKEKLVDITVYRIGTIQVDAFIIGKLQYSSYAGLRTQLIET